MSIDSPDALFGFVAADEVSTAPSSADLMSVISAELAGLGPLNDETRGAVRDLLRSSKYKPTGRGKPASEYLISQALQGAFPFVNAVVDVNNWFSVRTGFPMSTLDRVAALGGGRGFEIRLGEAEESYVFNASGQSISLHGLLGLAQLEGLMVGNPVKDSMLAKVTASTASTLTVIYASRRVTDRSALQAFSEEVAAAFQRYCGASMTRTRVLAAGEVGSF